MDLVKLKLIAPGNVEGGYVGNGLSMKVGDIANVERKLANYLLISWPTWFEIVEPETKKQVAPPAKNRAHAAPGKNR